MVKIRINGVGIVRQKAFLKASLFAVFYLGIALSCAELQAEVPNTKTYQVSGNSMLPTLKSGDRVTVSVHAYLKEKPQTNDLVAVRFSSRANPMVKRVIAVAGDTVHFDKKGLWCNGQLVPNIDVSLRAGRGKALMNQLKYYKNIIPQGNVILIGDNPRNSRDSFRYGLISEKQLVGKVLDVNDVPYKS